jgi:hypothetical protein
MQTHCYLLPGALLYLEQCVYLLGSHFNGNILKLKAKCVRASLSFTLLRLVLRRSVVPEGERHAVLIHYVCLHLL